MSRIRPIPWVILVGVFVFHCILDYDDVGRDLWSLMVLFLAIACAILVWQLSRKNPPPDR